MAAKWTEDSVRDMFINPVYAGVGPYAPLCDDAYWFRLMREIIRREGAASTLERTRRVLLRTFRRPIAAVASARFAAEGACAIGVIGLDAYLANLLRALREELADVPGDDVPELFGFQRQVRRAS